MLLSQRKPRGDTLVGAEEPPDEIRAVTLLAAMQQDDMIGQSAGTVEEFADGGEGLDVGQVAFASGDAALQEHGRALSACI